jgi:cell wall-associated NlpC family hydrolase
VIDADRDALVAAVMDSLELRSAGKRRGRVDLIEAIDGDPKVTQTIDGASTLELVVLDDQRRLVRAKQLLDERSWAVFDKLHFELVSVSKSGDRITLTFEDAIVAALRRQTSHFSIRAGKITRRGLAEKLAQEAKVALSVDPAKRNPVQRLIERSATGERTSSWDVLGEAAEDVQWRRFSDGRGLVMGSDDWLFDRDSDPTRIQEYTGPVQDIDFDLDVAARVSEATMTVDVAGWVLPPGSVVVVDDLGPADGKWLVSQIERGVTSPRATVTLVRGRHALKEPKRKRNSSAGDAGDPDFLPGQEGTDSGGTTANPARARMLDFALAQRGDTYVYGATGPAEWDCSGLVYKSTEAGGNQIPARDSAGQWAAVQAAGKTMSVETALKTRGALLFIQTEDVHHVAFSLGNGSTMEAKGSGYGVGIFTAYAPQYTGAGWWL